MQLVNPDIATYAHNHTSAESEEVENLILESDRELEHIDMLSGRVTGQLLAMLIRISGAVRVLEVGTFTGCSALTMAEALPQEGVVITCEYNRRYEDIARTAFAKSEHSHKITLKMGAALETIATLHEPFDLVFLDADKANYLNYYKAILPKLTQGGILVIDNVLWEGTVLQPTDEKATAIHDLNKTVACDPLVEQVMLTVRDGITVVRKK